MPSLCLWLRYFLALIFLLPTVYAIDITLTYGPYTYDAKLVMCGYYGHISHTVNSLAELTSLAQQAHGVMAATVVKNIPNPKKRKIVPSVMSAISYNGVVYFHSSVKACRGTQGKPSALLDILQGSLSAIRDEKHGEHRYTRKCGEVYVTNLMMTSLKMTSIDDFTRAPHKMISSVGPQEGSVDAWIKNPHQGLKTKIYPPCEKGLCDIKNVEWGCVDLVEWLRFLEDDVAGVKHFLKGGPKHRPRGRRLEKNPY